MILVTGGSGFLGRAVVELLAGQGEEIISVQRHRPDKQVPGVTYACRDIVNDDLNKDYWGNIDAVYHIAGTVNLSLQDKKDVIYNINVMGTRNVIQFCEEHKVPHLYYVSTAYTQFRNPYERSKATAEEFVKMAKIPMVTIFKPSIILGSGNSLEHFPLFAMLMIKFHHRADLIRRKLEGTLRLPIIEPVFRIKGNPDGNLNLIPLDFVAREIAKIKSAGTFWLTNPNPPTTQQIADWLGEAILLNIKVLPHFNAMPIEAGFMRLTKAFLPYLEGDDFHSDLSFHGGPLITRDTINEMVARMIEHADRKNPN
jgi:nucleoside-diphosphate-sugar epimerase